MRVLKRDWADQRTSDTLIMKYKNRKQDESAKGHKAWTRVVKIDDSAERLKAWTRVSNRDDNAEGHKAWTRVFKTYEYCFPYEKRERSMISQNW